MFIHVVFDNGAEPYLFKGSERMVNDELDALKTQWKLELLSIVNSGVFMKAFKPVDEFQEYMNTRNEMIRKEESKNGPEISQSE